MEGCGGLRKQAGSSGWRSSEACIYPSIGHYMLNILDDLQDVLNVEEFVTKKDEEDDDETTYGLGV